MDWESRAQKRALYSDIPVRKIKVERLQYAEAVFKILGGPCNA